MFKRILVAVDGSEYARQALREAVDLAKLADASLTAMTVSPDVATWLFAGGYGGLVPPVNTDELNEQTRRQYEHMLAEVLGSVETNGIATSANSSNGAA